ncbi:PilZ domain-containing protein [Undibacterium sp. SXout20W]|uniref:PilZ domain-containing protein n=1 Tax=Undibacterium sp. SXout20W TaxID=3413051 RepID=UPI003BF19E09
MIELRRAPRINVTWRAGVKLKDGRLLLCKAINISKTGLLLECSQALSPGKIYPLLIEVPSLVARSELVRVSCQCEVKHVVLSGDNYRVGVALAGLPGSDAELISAWVSMANQRATVV